MPSPATAIFTALLLSLTAGCSDDAPAAADSGVPPADTGAVADTGAAPDSAAPDSAAPDTGPAIDAGPPGTLTGNVTTTVTCPATTTDDDCMGTLYVGVFSDPTMAAMLASTLLPGSDLSGSASVAFSIAPAPAGAVYLAAYLDDNGNTVPPALQPDTGDPVTDPVVAVTVPSGAAATQDLVLTLRLP